MRNDRRDLVSEIDRCRDAQMPLGLLRELVDGCVRVGNGLKTFETVLQIHAAGLGEPDLSRRSIEQARANVRLKVGNMLGHGGGRHTQVARSCREA